jgi:hypothetical protein
VISLAERGDHTAPFGSFGNAGSRSRRINTNGSSG